MSIIVNRDSIWNCFISSVSNKDVDSFKIARFDINFEGEAGIDGGGLTKEFF